MGTRGLAVNRLLGRFSVLCMSVTDCMVVIVTVWLGKSWVILLICLRTLLLRLVTSVLRAAFYRVAYALIIVWVSGVILSVILRSGLSRVAFVRCRDVVA